MSNNDKYGEIDKEEEKQNLDLNLEQNQMLNEVQNQIQNEPIVEERQIEEKQLIEQPTVEEGQIEEQREPIVEEGQTEGQLTKEIKPEEQVQETTESSSQEITIKVDRTALFSLCQNLNSNIIVNIVAYKGILTKLMETEKDGDKKTQIDNNIKNLDEILSNSKNLMENVQNNLDIVTKIDPSKIEEEASKTTNLSDQLISAQVTSILASLATAAILVGGKKTKRKNSKRKQNKVKGKKQTKKRT